MDARRLAEILRSATRCAGHGSLSLRPRDDAPASYRDAERGQALVLFTLFFTVILGFAALVLDVGLLRKSNLDLQNSLDAGALAGVALLPDDAAGAERLALDYAHLNFPDALPDEDLDLGFRCLIGAVGTQPRLTDVPLVCDPGPGATWVVSGKVAIARCDPSRGNKCNTLVLQGPAERDFLIGPVLGVDRGSTPVQTSAACKGLCGEPPEVPLDLVLIVDRTSSMAGADTTNAVNAAHAVRKALRPSVQRLAFSALGPSKTIGTCITAPDTVIGTATPTSLRRWVPVGLSGTGFGTGDYTPDTSVMGKAIQCIATGKSGGPYNSSTGTDLADPVRMATYELAQSGRASAKKAILLVSDGQPNATTTASRNYCLDASKAAAEAKAAGIEVYTVAFGVEGILCDDTSGAWYRKPATNLLADMASNSANDGTCPGTENTDGDHFYCVPKTSDLTAIFQQAVAQMTGHSRLVKLPDGA
jgi:hypothetical protein